MLKAEFSSYRLKFKETAITSRSQMNDKETFLISIYDDENPLVVGQGECALFRGLSTEDNANYEAALLKACQNPENLPEVSSIRFGFETAINNLNANNGAWTDNPFTRGEQAIRINGLIWMGDKVTMLRRIKEKLALGFYCIKLKIGGINFEDELQLLKGIRREFSADDVELRVDANGAFTPQNAMERLHRLAELNLHSIEQPIRQGQWDAMAQLCQQTPLPIALDEELIGFNSDAQKAEMLDAIKPQYIILKPSLCGGFAEADSWIKHAQERGIGWWATSALESNIGLDAIAQWVSKYSPTIPQGLGTGALYTNNFQSRLRINGEMLHYAGK